VELDHGGEALVGFQALPFEDIGVLLGMRDF
jgi:hypothetical protein